VALAAALRVARIARAPLVHPDGPAYVDLARKVLDGEWTAVFGGYYSPLYPVVIAPLVGLGIDAELAGRLVAAIAGVAAVVVVHRLARRAFGEPAATAAALVTALSPALVKASADVLPETLAALTLLAAFDVLADAADPPAFALAGALAGATYLARPEGALVVALGIFPAARRRPASLIAYLTAALGVMAPALLALHARSGTWQLSPREAVIAGRFGSGADASLAAVAVHHPAALARTWAGGAVQQTWDTVVAIGPVLVVPLVAGLVRTRVRPRWLADVAAAFALGPLALNPSPRYAVPTLGLLLPFAGAGVATVRERLGRWSRPVVLVACAVLAVQALWKSKTFDEACAHEIRDLVLARYGPGQAIVAVDGRFAASVGGHPIVPKTDDPEAALALVRARGARLWITRPAWLGRSFVAPPELHEVARPCSGVFVMFEAPARPASP
jgi:4-amino-4-deoxy-L-arabinose transferase-like glycosyltransferase